MLEQILNAIGVKGFCAVVAAIICIVPFSVFIVVKCAQEAGKQKKAEEEKKAEEGKENERR